MAITPHYHNAVKRLKKLQIKKKHLKLFGKNVLWFTLGSVLGLFFFISFLLIYYQNSHANHVYDGVLVNGVDFGGKTADEVKKYFDDKNNIFQKTTLTLQSSQTTATISAKKIDFGYDSALLAHQAMTVGRSDNNELSDLSIIFQAYTSTINLPSAYNYTDGKLAAVIEPIKNGINVAPIDPLFNIADGKVTTFRLGTDGRALDQDGLKKTIINRLKYAISSSKSQNITIALPIKTIRAEGAENEASNLGIKEEVAEGTSLFRGSNPDRIFNISLAANKLNGVIIKPNQVFSFDKTVGDISAESGYHQAYVIQNGKTVLGDGGGVCQVSTTLFRAALNAGLPIVERHQHAYRVGYYEQNSGPGIDAAIYTPTVDLKFKNDTGHALLIQTYLDQSTQSLAFALYGTKDNREVSISDPVVSSTTPAPPVLNQDDPTLPKGQVKQVDFAADGAEVYFSRTVTKDGKQTMYDKFTSHYKPWQAVYMHGTM
ncbi:MAG: VanW family protein [Candidatus Levyibacteriota bacterium]